MKTRLIILTSVFVVVLSAVTLGVVRHHSVNNHKFVKVGGESNQCECTYRIERSDDSWLSSLFPGKRTNE